MPYECTGKDNDFDCWGALEQVPSQHKVHVHPACVWEACKGASSTWVLAGMISTGGPCPGRQSKAPKSDPLGGGHMSIDQGTSNVEGTRSPGKPIKGHDQAGTAPRPTPPGEGR